MNEKIYSIYKYLPKYICRIINTIKNTRIGGTQLLDKAPPPCDYARSIGLLPMEPEQLLEMTELVPRLVFCAEVFCIHTGGATLRGLATSRECLQLHSRLPWKPWLLLLERTYDCHLQFPRRSRPPAHKCIDHFLLNGGAALLPHHNNSHPPLSV